MAAAAINMQVSNRPIIAKPGRHQCICRNRGDSKDRQSSCREPTYKILSETCPPQADMEFPFTVAGLGVSALHLLYNVTDYRS